MARRSYSKRRATYKLLKFARQLGARSRLPSPRWGHLPSRFGTSPTRIAPASGTAAADGYPGVPPLAPGFPRTRSALGGSVQPRPAPPLPAASRRASRSLARHPGRAARKSRSAATITGRRTSVATRFIAFSNSRTLPGQVWASSRLAASALRRFDPPSADDRAKKCSAKRNDIRQTLAQRRQGQRHDTEPVIQVFAEPSVTHRLERDRDGSPRSPAHRSARAGRQPA